MGVQNYMGEASRLKGIEVYTRYIRLFALQCLATRAATEGVRIDLCASDLPEHGPSVLAPAGEARRRRMWRQHDDTAGTAGDGDVPALVGCRR